MLAATAALIVAPIAAGADQNQASPARIGYLMGRARDFETPWLAAFRQGLRDLGYVEGQNVVIEERYSEGRTERLPALGWPS